MRDVLAIVVGVLIGVLATCVYCSRDSKPCHCPKLPFPVKDCRDCCKDCCPKPLKGERP